MPLIIDARQAVSEHIATTRTRLLPWAALFLLEEVMIGGGGEESFEEFLE